jgi:hypothetical protein
MGEIRSCEPTIWLALISRLLLCSRPEDAGVLPRANFSYKKTCTRQVLMADAGGFEPPTARFVAEYSIQLSYASGVSMSFDRSYYCCLLSQTCKFCLEWRTREDSNLRPLGS